MYGQVLNKKKNKTPFLAYFQAFFVFNIENSKFKILDEPPNQEDNQGGGIPCSVPSLPYS